VPLGTEYAKEPVRKDTVYRNRYQTISKNPDKLKLGKLFELKAA
jgi:hypothetical protein